MLLILVISLTAQEEESIKCGCKRVQGCMCDKWTAVMPMNHFGYQGIQNCFRSTKYFFCGTASTRVLYFLYVHVYWSSLISHVDFWLRFYMRIWFCGAWELQYVNMRSRSDILYVNMSAENGDFIKVYAYRFVQILLQSWPPFTSMF